MQINKAGLEEMFRLYILSRSLPSIVSILKELVDTYQHEQQQVQQQNEGETNNDGNDKGW